MKRNRYWALLLTAVLTTGMLAGCGGGNEDSTQGTAENEAPEQQPEGALDEEAAESVEGTGSESESSETDTAASAAGAYGAGEWRTYDEEITLTFGDPYDINNEGFTAMANIGEPYDDNRWIRYYREEVGVNAEYSLLAPNTEDYKQMLTLAMTSGDLPDVFWVPDMITYQQLVDAEAVADLTTLYQTEANPTLKELVEGEGDNFLDNYKVDGKLYCVPGKMPSTNGYSYLWLRKDWLDKLGLAVPKTMDEVADVARAFATQDPDGNGKDDTIGLSIDSSYTKMGSMGIFWAFGGKLANNNFWCTQEDGTVGFSMVQPEVKDALKWLNTLYEEGILNQEFSTFNFVDYPELLASNRCGMFYGCHWYAIYINAIKDEIPEAEWIPILAPGTDGNPAPVYANVDTNGLYCVNAACENPEAAFAVFNAYVEKLFGEQNDFENFFACEVDSNVWQRGPVSMLAADTDLKPHREMKEALKNDAMDELTGVGASYWKYIQEGSLTYQLEFGPEGSCFNLVDDTYPDIFNWNAYQGVPTQTQAARAGGMQEIIDTAYIKMINGELEIEEGFDKMVSDWMAAGGEQVTQEVNEMIAAR